MVAVFLDAAMDDDTRRQHLYRGDLFLYTPRPATLALVEHARGMIEGAFGGKDPRTAQYEMSVEEFVDVCAPLKPAFIHHQRTKELIQAMLVELGCDAEQTYFDVPRLRSMTSDDYLKAGVGYQFHPHRDTWFSAPLAQLNWWMPIYEITPESSMAFHPRYFDEGVKNSSDEYNYYEWNQTGRVQAAKQIKTETRKQPKAEEEVELDPQIRLIPPPGGVMVFSGAQFHSTVPNTSGATRYSIDLRTVHRGDLEKNLAAPNVDSAPQGTTLRDFLHVTDLARLPEELVLRYDNVEEHTGVLIFDPAQEQT
jgi:hypothetical protein